jgi:hypothetical protein
MSETPVLIPGHSLARARVGLLQSDHWSASPRSAATGVGRSSTASAIRTGARTPTSPRPVERPPAGARFAMPKSGDSRARVGSG